MGRVKLSDAQEDPFDKSIVNEFGQWLVEEPGGRLSLSIFVVVMILLCGCCMYGICRENSAQLKDTFSRSMRSLRGLGVPQGYAEAEEATSVIPIAEPVLNEVPSVEMT